MSGACDAKICKCSTDICQLRLDFVTFVINGPSTDTMSKSKIKLGSDQDNGGFAHFDFGVCTTDSFRATTVAGKSSPVICGTNSGYHSEYY